MCAVPLIVSRELPRSSSPPRADLARQQSDPMPEHGRPSASSDAPLVASRRLLRLFRLVPLPLSFISGQTPSVGLYSQILHFRIGRIANIDKVRALCWLIETPCHLNLKHHRRSAMSSLQYHWRVRQPRGTLALSAYSFPNNYFRLIRPLSVHSTQFIFPYPLTPIRWVWTN